jgi:glycosyltransferase involved in cell wall biosynthesis
LEFFQQEKTGFHQLRKWQLMVSIIMPAYNEADIIESCVREWHAEVVSRISDSELIIVDDCSLDTTGDIVKRLSRELPGLRYIRTSGNGGHGPALRVGFDAAQCPWIFQTDSDRQHLPADFWKLWAIREKADFVFSIREHRADGLVRLAITHCMRVFNFIIWGIWVRDANCPFKLMRSEALARVLSKVPRDCFIPMVMVSLLSRRMRFRVIESRVTHLPRRGGSQSLHGLAKWILVAWICSRQIMLIRFAARIQ